jgi:hypothetical protein
VGDPGTLDLPFWSLAHQFRVVRDPGVSAIDLHKPTYQEFEFSRGGYLKYLNHALVSVVLPGAGHKIPYADHSVRLPLCPLRWLNAHSGQNNP